MKIYRQIGILSMLLQKDTCEIWRKTKDPAFAEEEFERNIQERVDRLKGG